MYGDKSNNMPIGLAMSLSSNPEAFRQFLKMSDSEQDKIMQRARKTHSIIELKQMVDALGTHPDGQM